MIKKWILSGLFLMMLTIYAHKQVLRIENPSPETVTFFFENKFDVAAYRPDVFIDVVATNEELQLFQQKGYHFMITQTEQQLKENLHETKDIPGYRNYDNVLQDLLNYQAEHPSLCKLYNIGYSRGYEYATAGNSYYNNYSHPIWALKVSDNVEIEEDEPSIYYLGAHHAREPISTEVVMTVLEHFMTNYEVDPEITHNINNSQIWFVPIVNPDGHKVVITEVDVWWRKNICDNNNNGVFDTMNYYGNGIDGVDLNRNYGWQWATTGASGYINDPTYYGTEAFSEPETSTIRNLLAAHHFVAGISYHSYSELVLFPFGYANGVIAPDKDALEDLAMAMALTIPANNTPTGFYLPMPAWELYPASGTTDDYAYGEHGIFSYTIELATQFIPPANQINGICNDNIEAAKILLNRINFSTLTGVITDATSMLPLSGEVFVHEIDSQGAYRKPYKSNESFGRYYRMLADGLYTVTFSAFGYESVTVSNVAITSQGQTVLDIALSSSTLYTVESTVLAGETNVPVENVIVDFYYNLNDEPVLQSITDSNGYFTFNQIPSGEYQLVFRHDNFATLLSSITVNNHISTTFYLFEPRIISFENNELADFSFSGNAPWTLVNNSYYEGSHSVRSGSINSWQSSKLILNIDLAHAGEISFFKKVSTEANYDFFYFKIDGVTKGQWSGEMNWSESNYYISAGEHTLEWSYEKDGYVEEGSDCAWIDYLRMPKSAGEIYFYPPRNLQGSFINQNTAIQLTWDAPYSSEADLTSYHIYRNGNMFAAVNFEIQTYTDLNPVASNDGNFYYYLIANYSNPDGYSLPSNEIMLEPFSDSVIETINYITELKGNFPNPFNPSTTFYFSLQNPENIELNIFNIKGQKVKSFKKENLQAGNHQIEWNGKDEFDKNTGSGIFFYQLKTKNYQSIKKMILLK